MKKNIVYKALTVFVIFFLFITNAIAAGIEKNVISKIIIDPAVDNTVTLNLLFDKEFTGNAFLQKRDIGSYQVFLPDTITSGKRPQIIFKDNKDRSRMNIDVLEKPFIKENKKSKYIKVSVDMVEDYSIKLVSGVKSDYNVFLIFLKSLDYPTIGLFSVLALALILLFKASMHITSSSKKKKVNARYPSAMLNSPSDYLRRVERKEERQTRRAMLPKQEIKNTIKPVDKNSFDCFELPFAEENKQANEYEFKSTLNQASKILKEKPTLSKLRHTNPINRDYSELSMPLIDDLIKEPRQKRKEENNQPQAELLSVLNITPSKGFYLTTVEDTLALFGFINENVFLLKKFKDLSQINLQARYYDRNGNNDIYIVRLDSYRAMIEISESSMKELAKI